jgi:U3 small nucleolar RNA-associated protein 15
MMSSLDDVIQRVAHVLSLSPSLCVAVSLPLCTAPSMSIESTAFQKTPVRRFPRLTERPSGEQRFWRRYKFPTIVREHSMVSHLDCSGGSDNSPAEQLAVTAGARVVLYSARTLDVRKTITRFGGATGVFSGVLRSDDGRLLAAGTDDGHVQVLDVASRAVLRRFPHADASSAAAAAAGSEGGGAENATGARSRAAVHVVRWMPQALTRLFSAGDDAVVCTWDLASSSGGGSGGGSGEAPLTIMRGHGDYIRAGAGSPSSADVLLTGSYDHTVKLWDARAGHCVMTMRHGDPVESVLFLPGGGMAVSAGGSTISVWDLLQGGRRVHTISRHHKTVLALALDASRGRLLSGGLDQHLNVYDTRDFRCVHTIRYPAPVMSVLLTPDGSLLTVGMANNTFSCRRRVGGGPASGTDADDTPANGLSMTSSGLYMGFGVGNLQERSGPRGGTFAYYVRGKNVRALPDQQAVTKDAKSRQRPHDKLLRRFKYHDALSAVMDERGEDPTVVISVLEELARRGGLSAALRGREPARLENVLRFVERHLVNPRFSHMVVDVANVILGTLIVHVCG